MNPLVAVAQLTSTSDVARNLSICARLVREARARGASLVALPENFAFIGSKEGEAVGHAETIPAPGGPGAAGGAGAQDGPILSAMRAAARDSQVWLLLGGMPERPDAAADAGHRMHNTSVLLAPDGSVRARYRKIHLFDVAIPHGATFQESRTVAPGGEPVVAETPLGPLGLSVCYDVRFPELYRALAAHGARLLAVPAAFTAHTGKDHWHVLLRARAIENQCWVLAPAQFGRPNETRQCYGHALVVDSWGQVVAESSEREGVVVAEIDASYQDKVRRELPCLTHRRL